ncbi:MULTISPECIES: SDR family oxidoreductase [Streptomyces]|uniref:SDR family oxidoreductase n=1 Tax=Streptomyces abikoensis TaxID=97398 RepID=A0ABW7T800_9ACTN|nr:SDR family oxidoreductase [Streptomyces luteoverticillatus]
MRLRTDPARHHGQRRRARVIGTERIRRAGEDRPESWTAERVSHIPAGRFWTVAEAAGMVRHLCGEHAGYTTGTVVDVNGGLHI